QCLAGAIKWEDLILHATEAGFTQPRLITAKPIDITDPDIEKLVGDIRFVTATFRLFKIPMNEDELDIPYLLTYEGEIPGFESAFSFDNTITFKRGEMVSCGPTLASAILYSRYKDNFGFEPIDNTKHFDGTVVVVEEQETLFRDDGVTETTQHSYIITEYDDDVADKRHSKSSSVTTDNSTTEPSVTRKNT
ncbi:unnamed protein product, partial [Didymodactylos carnosus]